MALLILSFVAGVLTVAAPCILPLLPVIIGGSVLEGGGKDKNGKLKNSNNKWLRPLIIAGSLAVSVVLFSLLLKATTSLLGVPQQVWQIVAGSIVILLGLNYLIPEVWEKFSTKIGLFSKANKGLGKAYKYQGWLSPVLIGLALGPVFSSCSPTYGLIVATVLPASLAQGTLYLIVYALGMSLTLLLISYAGQAVVEKLKLLTDPKGLFVKIIGITFVLIGLGVIFGLDKQIQTFVLENGWYDPISNLEEKLR